MKAWANLSRYEAGTNLRAWLFTILRNTFYSEPRNRRRGRSPGGRTLHAGPAERPHGFRGFPGRASAIGPRPARSSDPRRRIRSVVRGSGGDLRLRGRHDKEPRQSGARPPRGTARPRVGERGADPAARTRQAERCRKSRRAGRGLAKLTRRSSSGSTASALALTPERRASSASFPQRLERRYSAAWGPEIKLECVSGTRLCRDLLKAQLRAPRNQMLTNRIRSDLGTR
jgi:hypothetical protein